MGNIHILLLLQPQSVCCFALRIFEEFRVDAASAGCPFALFFVNLHILFILFKFTKNMFQFFYFLFGTQKHSLILKENKKNTQFKWNNYIAYFQGIFEQHYSPFRMQGTKMFLCFFFVGPNGRVAFKFSLQMIYFSWIWFNRFVQEKRMGKTT